MEAGIYDNMSIEQYHAEKDWVSASGMKYAMKSLRHYWYYLRGAFDSETKKHFDFGNAFELALLDPEEFDKKVAVEKDIYDKIFKENPETKSPRSTKAYKEWHDEQKRLNKYVISEDGEQSFLYIENMLRSCHMDKSIQRLIKNINYQVSIFCQDKETGLKMKTRPDFLKTHKNIVVDVKTAIDGSKEAFGKVIANNNLWLQAAIQIEGVTASGLLDNVDAYYWLVVEKKPPFNATIYHFQPSDIAWALDNLAYYKKLLSEAIKKDIYVGYTQQADNPYGIVSVELPVWVKNNY
jgi:hypothetical protein